MQRLLLCLVLAMLPASVFAQSLRIHGSNTIGERLAPALAEAWLRAEGFERIERSQPAPNELTLRATGAGGRQMAVEIRAHGTSTGFVDLARGEADIAMASRPANAAEVEQARALGRLDSPAQEAVIALDGVAVIVHPANPLRELSLEAIRDVFAGKVRDWSALGGAPGPIRLHARDERSGTWETFRTLVLDTAPLAAGATRYESTHELAEAVAADPAAIGFAAVSGIGQARALSIADSAKALSPEAFTVAVEDYPLSRRLFLYSAAQRSAAAASFVEFSQSAAGQRVVEATGFIAQEVRPYRIAARSDAPLEYRDLVSGAQRLSVNFRFGSGSRLLDGKTLRDVERLVAFMQEPANRERDLLLLGFVDASETSAYLATSLSNDRVDLVANLLQDRGIPAARSRGMGGTAPVANNRTDSGRQRNRRVEVWIR